MLNWNWMQIEDRGYDPGGRLTNVDRAFTDETRTYDAANRLTSISNTGVGQTTYSWDANGNKLGETWDGSMAAWSFTTQKFGASQFIDGYDAEDRFRRFIRSGQNEDRYFDRSMIGNIFDIDTNGNHTPRTFGLAHELTAIATDPQSFDAEGNVTQIPGSLRGMTSDILLSWDFDNRLKSSTVDSTTTDYGYDATGRRVSKGSVVFVYGGAGQQNCIAEYASAAAPTSPDREFVYGDSIDSLVLISDTNDTRRLLATRNQQWSIVALVDLSDGSVVERYTYDHFGARRVLDASGAEISGSGQYGMSASRYGNPYGYTSRRHDIESGLMYFRARFYDPTTGEFLTRDPLGYVDGMSLYRAYFVPGEVDPQGNIQQSVTDKIVAYDFFGSPIYKGADGKCYRFFNRRKQIVPCPGTYPDDPEGPTYGDGILELFTISLKLKKLCNNCTNEWDCGHSDCNRQQCYKEAAHIQKILLLAWKSNYGVGKHGSKGHCVAGSFCWDWAYIFTGSLMNQEFSCFTAETDGALGPESEKEPGKFHQHWYTRIKISSANECHLVIDDGFLDGKVIHDNPAIFPRPGGPYVDVDPTTMTPGKEPGGILIPRLSF